MKPSEERFELLKLERQLDEQFQKISLIGQLPIQRDDFEQIIQKAASLLQGQRNNLRLIPDKVYLLLMTFCARFEDTSEKGFWEVFLDRLRLPTDLNTQNKCREQFKEARRCVPFLHFPKEGYACVTPVYYHAMIPQLCVPDMVKLIWRLNKDPGWSVVTDLGTKQLAELLPATVSHLHLAKPLARFVQSANSQQIAVTFIHDICESAHLWQEGTLQSDEIALLLQDNPAQKEIWELLKAQREESISDLPVRSNFPPPRWQWDITARQLQLIFPKQYIAAISRPRQYKVESIIYTVQSNRSDSFWIVEAITLDNLPIDLSNSGRLSIDMLGDNGSLLHRWVIKVPFDDLLIFKANSQVTNARLIPFEDGIAPGAYSILYRRGLSLKDVTSTKSINLIKRLFPPQGWESFEAELYELAPPIKILDEAGEEVHTIKLATDVSRQITLINGTELLEAADPEGFSVFVGQPPDLVIATERRLELENIHIQIRSLPPAEAVTITKSIRDLFERGDVSWSDEKCELTINLKKLLSGKTEGRFRVKFLRGLISARYAPIEFILVPEIAVSSLSGLFTKDQPPQVTLKSHHAKRVYSDYGKVEKVSSGEYRIEWPVTANQFSAVVEFAHIFLPMRWTPNVLRACLVSQDATIWKWAEQLPALSQNEMTFEKRLYIQGFPNAKYEIGAGDSVYKRSSFGDDAILKFVLAEFSDHVRHTASTDVTLFIKVFIDKTEHRLSLLRVFNNPKIEGFEFDLIDRNLLLKGCAYGQSEGEIELVLFDLLRPWQSAIYLKLPNSAFANQTETSVVVLPESFQPSFYRLQVQLRHEDGTTIFLDQDNQQLVFPFLDLGFSSTLQNLDVESTELTGERLFMLAIAATEPRNIIPQKQCERLWQRAAAEKENWQLTARALTNLTFENELSTWSAKTYLLKGFASTDLIVPVLNELLCHPINQSRRALSKLYDEGLNFAEVSFDELQDALNGSDQPKLDKSRLWELWLPLGAIFELNHIAEMHDNHLWIEMLGYSPLWHNKGLKVSLTKTPTPGRKTKSRPIQVEVEQFDEKSGETTGRCIKGFNNRTWAHWNYPLGSHNEICVWFEIEKDDERHYAWHCICGAVLTDENERHDHSREWGEIVARPITPETPIKMQLRRNELPAFDLKRLIDFNLMAKFATSLAIPSSDPEIKHIAEIRTQGHYPVFNRRFFVKACAQLHHNYFSHDHPERKNALDKLVSGSIFDKLNVAINRLVVGDEITPTLFSDHAGQLIKKCYLECTKHHLSHVPHSKLYTMSLALAILNRLWAHEPPKCEQAMREASITQVDLAVTSAHARRGCRLLFDHAICLVESILVWYRKQERDQ